MMNAELARQHARISAIRARIHAGAVIDTGIDLRRLADPPTARYVVVSGPQHGAHVVAWRRVERSRSSFGVRPNDALDVVSDVYDVRSDVLLAHCNLPRAARARHMLMYICCTHSVRSLKSVAMAFDRDHSAVFYGAKTIRQRLEAEDGYTIDRLRECRRRLGLDVAAPAS